MTLDEAIERYGKFAEAFKQMGMNSTLLPARSLFECAEEYEQLVEWLKELKARRAAEDETD